MSGSGLRRTKELGSFYFVGDGGAVGLLVDDETGFSVTPFFFNNSFPNDNFNVATAFPDDSERRKTSFVCI